MAYYTNPSYYGYYPQVQPMSVPMIYPQQIEQQQQPQQPQVNDSHFIWVQGEAGAKSYPVARGTTLPLFDSEGDYVYFKSVDNNGVPLPLVTKVISDPPFKEKTKVIEEKEVKVDMSNYVTKEIYDELKKKLNTTVHHLYSLSSIYNDVINELEMSTKLHNTIKNNNLSEKDKQLIISKVVEKHTNNIGILIDKDIHIAFHKQYGYGGNTPEQFDEFLRDNYSLTLNQIMKV